MIKKIVNEIGYNKSLSIIHDAAVELAIEMSSKKVPLTDISRKLGIPIHILCEHINDGFLLKKNISYEQYILGSFCQAILNKKTIGKIK